VGGCGGGGGVGVGRGSMCVGLCGMGHKVQETESSTGCNALHWTQQGVVGRALCMNQQQDLNKGYKRWKTCIKQEWHTLKQQPKVHKGTGRADGDTQVGVCTCNRHSFIRYREGTHVLLAWSTLQV
jgi:hypothetical protein